jgi:hypothetical protein
VTVDQIRILNHSTSNKESGIMTTTISVAAMRDSGIDMRALSDAELDAVSGGKDCGVVTVVTHSSTTIAGTLSIKTVYCDGKAIAGGATFDPA